MSSASRLSLTLVAVASVAVWTTSCVVDVEVDGGRCDEAHPCSAGWTCGAEGMCVRDGTNPSGDGGGTPDGGQVDSGTGADAGDGGFVTDGGDAGQSGLVLGAPCTSAAQCSSAFCVDGVCCDGACVGECVRCNAAGSAGTCTHAAVRTDPDAECGKYYCTADGGCATECAEDNDCQVGTCESVGGSRRACI